LFRRDYHRGKLKKLPAVIKFENKRTGTALEPQCTRVWDLQRNWFAKRT